MNIKDRPKEVRFANTDLKTAFNKLKNGKGDEQELYKHILRAINKLEQDPFIGERVQKHLISEFYIQKYDINNLRKFNLTSSWRMIYTIVGEKLLIISVILEWLNHKEYERRFKY